MATYYDNLISKAKSAIHEKINEPSVLYALVQLNKAVEDRGFKSEFASINFYRNWLVHNALDRSHSKIKAAFEKWDELLDGIKTGITIDEATKKTVEVIGLGNLFKELNSLGLDIEQSKKGSFVEALVSGLTDAPVRWSGKHVKEFRFTFDEQRKKDNQSYICHMQIQHKSDKWFDGPEIHIAKTS